MAAPRRIPLIPIDPGWLFVIAGVTAMAATAIIPAMDDLEEARWQRDRALAIERHRMDRLERHGSYLEALLRGDEAVVLALAAEQLNRVPEGWIPLAPVTDPMLRSASVFPALEPPPIHIEPRVQTDSRLARWARGEKSRLLLLIGGAVCVLIGLLPPERRP